MIEPVFVPSRIDAVALYRSGALVTRVAELPAMGSAHVRIGPLPLDVDDGSVRVAVRGGSVVATDVRVTLEVAEPDSALPPARPEDIDTAEQRVEKLRDQLDQVRTEVARVEQLGVAVRPETKVGREPPKSPSEARLALLELRERRITALDEQHDRLIRDLREAERRLADLWDRERLASSARRAEPHELKKAAILTLRGDRSEPATLEIQYRVGAARWVPTYLLRLDRDLASGALELRAMVCQRTGEDWNGVELTLSTAELRGWAELPELASIRIGRRQPAPAKRGWRAPPVGAAELFQDYDRVRADTPLAKAAPPLRTPPSRGARAEPAARAKGKRQILATDESRARADHGAADDGAEAYAMLDEQPMDAPAPMPQGAAAPYGGATPLAASEMFAGAMPASAPMASAPMAAPQSLSRSGGLLSAIGDVIGGAVDSIAELGAQEMGGAPGSAGMREHGARDPERTFDAPADLLDYGSLRIAAPDHATRGRLVWQSRRALYLELVEEERIEIDLDRAFEGAEEQRRRCATDALPDGCRPLAPSGFDYVYRAHARLNVASDGVFHNLTVSRHETTARARFVVVPREARDAFRFVEIDSPLDAPLLEGPIDVVVGEDFLLTSRLHEVPPGGVLRLGLGVEQRIKVSRNARFAEKTSGLMGGKLDLEHALEIELSNQLARDAEIEVRERLPVTREGEDDIAVKEGHVSPPWEEWEPEEDDALEGGRRWQITVPAGEKSTLSAEYTIRIAAKHELVGGNRRER
jgi:hypothetical protein